LEALISHQTKANMSALLGSAAANVSCDPWLRNLRIVIDGFEPDLKKSARNLTY